MSIRKICDLCNCSINGWYHSKRYGFWESFGISNYDIILRKRLDICDRCWDKIEEIIKRRSSWRGK